jgi:glycosyltransferase involved in cell wall biosynthesis
VPSRAYVNILRERGYPAGKLRVFERGINASLFHYREKASRNFTLVWAGRVSHDKNIDVLLDIFLKVREQVPGLRLLMAGAGPDFDHFRALADTMDGVTLLGHVPHEKLPDVYNSGDLMVFPSTMDTFGMVVLEALACGLPALVTDIGGPQEIVEHGVTGQVLPAHDLEAWVAAVRSHVERKAQDPAAYASWRESISRNILAQFSWEKVLTDIIDHHPPVGPAVQEEPYSKSA